jgi:hypothetical protein
MDDLENNSSSLSSSKETKETKETQQKPDEMYESKIDRFSRVDIYDATGKLQRILIFNGNEKPESGMERMIVSEKEEDIFKDLEIDPTIEYTNFKQQIHEDDTIHTIKQKIARELGELNISIEEIYLFTTIKTNIFWSQIYSTIVKEGAYDFSLQHILQLRKNSTHYFTVDENKKTFTYDEFLLLSTENGLEKTEETVKVALGQKFVKYRDPLFSANPFDILIPKVFSSNNTENPLFLFENRLLMNHGYRENRPICLCLAEDVLQYAIEHGIEESFIIETYYPLLFQKGVDSLEKLKESKQGFRKSLNPKKFSIEKSIDLLYDVQKSTTAPIVYSNRGIQSFHMIIHPEVEILLPLEAIFKNIHATKETPLIKYNPGSRRESVFRVYSEKLSTMGKKIPYMTTQKLIPLSKSIGKKNQISFYIYSFLLDDTPPIEIFMDIESNGNIIIRSELINPTNKVKWTIHKTGLYQIFNSIINPILNNINLFLGSLGYNINIPHSLDEDTIEYVDLTYFCQVENAEKFSLENNKGCLTTIFQFLRRDSKSKEGTELIYKRIENYCEMDARNMAITQIYNRTMNTDDVIRYLIDTENISKEVAVGIFGDYLKQFYQTQGRFINKSVDIVDNPGFRSSIKWIPSENNKVEVEIKGVSHIQYIGLFDIYLDSYFHLSIFPNTIGSNIPKIAIKNICSLQRSLKNKNSEEKAVSNIIANKTAMTTQKNIFLKQFEEGLEEGFEEEELIPDVFDGIEEEEEGIEEEKGEGEEVVSDLFQDIEEEEEEEAEEEAEEEEEEEIGEPETFEDLAKSESQGEEFQPDLFNELSEEESKESKKTKKTKESSSEEIKEDLFGELSEEASEEVSPKRGGTKPIKDKTFKTKLVKYDPALFKTNSKNPNDVIYSRVCPAVDGRVPVIVNKDELDYIDKNNPGSYDYALPYGSDPKKQNYYMCPRYWCMSKNIPLTEEQVKAGVCEKNDIHSFEKGKGTYDTPSFINKKYKNVNGENKCLPCCFKKSFASFNENLKTCGVNLNDVKGAKKEEALAEIKKNEEKSKKDYALPTNYIIEFKKYPIPEGRWGFLHPSIQIFLQQNYTDARTEQNQAIIKSNKSILLRYGTEKTNNDNQSFLSCIADVYGSLSLSSSSSSSTSTSTNNKTPTLSEFKKILIDAITLDDYIRLQNGSLVPTFQPKKRVQITDIENYKENRFYQENIGKRESQYDFLEDTIASFENFQQYLLDDKMVITHQYLWDVVSMKNPRLFPNGLNLIIIEKSTLDMTENVQLICPSSSNQDKYYDPIKESIILYKQEDLYEPIYLYSKKGEGSKIDVMKRFSSIDTTPELKRTLEMIQQSTNKQCKPTPSMPRVYTFKENISTSSLQTILKGIGYTIKSQVANYNRRIIGFLLSKVAGIPPLFLPCSPSPILVDGKKETFPIQYMDSITWSNYENTKKFLFQIHQASNGKILSTPKLKVIEDGLIVGIITETNQFIQIEPPMPFTNDEGDKDELRPYELMGYKNKGYFIADKALTLNPEKDKERIKAIRDISLESKFYVVFRNTIRMLLNDYENREIRILLKTELEKRGVLYPVHLKRVYTILQFLIRGEVEFFEYDTQRLDLLKEIDDIVSCRTTSIEQPYCGIKDKNGVFYIPKKNLIDDRIDNELNYIARVADELIRHKRIRNFIFEPKKYLNITNLEYKIGEHEILLLESLISSYLKDMKSFQTNTFIQNIPFEMGIPSTTAVYEKHVNWNEEGKNAPVLHTEDEESDSEEEEEEGEENIQKGGGGGDNKDHIKSIKSISTKLRANTYWKNIFPKNTIETYFYRTRYSSFALLQTIYTSFFVKTKTIKTISQQEIRTILWKEYENLYNKSTKNNKFIQRFEEEGKKCLERGGKKLKLEETIKGSNYYITNLDIWVFSSHYDIPIILYSNKNGEIFRTLDTNWLLCNYKQTDNENLSNKTYFFVFSDKPYNNRENGNIPEYSLVESSTFKNIFKTKLGNTDYPIGNKNIDAYI